MEFGTCCLNPMILQFSRYNCMASNKNYAPKMALQQQMHPEIAFCWNIILEFGGFFFHSQQYNLKAFFQINFSFNVGWLKRFRFDAFTTYATCDCGKSITPIRIQKTEISIMLYSVNNSFLYVLLLLPLLLFDLYSTTFIFVSCSSWDNKNSERVPPFIGWMQWSTTQYCV